MTTETLDAPVELLAELTALQQLALKHQREFMRLRTAEIAKRTGQPVRYTRDRMTAEQLAALPDVTDASGAVLQAGMKVRCPDGLRATVQRVDKRSRRCVVERSDGSVKMTVAKRLTILNTGGRRAQQQAQEVA